jgi:hypothetical protein
MSAAIVPFISLFFVVLIFRQFGSPWRESILDAAVLWGLLLTGITEILSFGGGLIYPWILTSWLLCGTVSALFYVRIRKGSGVNSWSVLPTTSLPLSLLLPIGFIVSVTGFIAFVAPPNSGDSHTYHLSRVMHWIQNHGVQHYPTSIVRQLFSPPWAEFATLHLYVLSGGDRLVNGVQWLSMVGSLLGVSLIAKQLGGDRKCQLLAALVVACVPIGILQASSTQNDYVVTFWLVCFAYYVLLVVDAIQIQGSFWRASVLAGISMGLAILTKATAYFYVFPFAIWLSFVGLRGLGAKYIKMLLAIGVIALLINLGHYVRNFEMFGSPLTPVSSREVHANSAHSPGLILSNVLKNLAWDLAMPTPFDAANHTIQTGIAHLHRLLGVDVNDKNTTFPGQKFILMTLRPNEDYAGYPGHLLLIGVCLGWLGVVGPRGWSLGKIYMGSLLGGYFLFCLLVKWEPWNSRLHLPFFVLCSASVATMMSHSVFSRMRTYVIVLLVVTSQYPLFLNYARPLIGSRSGLGVPSILSAPRADQYFTFEPDRFSPYGQAAKLLHKQGCMQIGLWLSHRRKDDEYAWEYPFWVLLKFGSNDRLRIEHVNVINESAKKNLLVRFREFEPYAIVTVSRYGDEVKPSRISTGDKTYSMIWQEGIVAVYQRLKDEP